MKTSVFIFPFIVLAYLSCSQNPDKKKIETWKNEIVQTELNFANMAKQEGMNKAFLEFAADDGVLMRNDRLIKGKDSIKDFIKNSTSKGLSWKPDFVDVSISGDLGYTYGTYVYKYKDSLGNDKSSEGIFHTVWKRQTDNSWKFVWD